MQRLEAMEQPHVARTRPLPAPGWCRRSRVFFHGELEKLPFRRPAKHPRNPRVEKPDDCLQHGIGSVRVTAMNPEHSAVKAQHDGAVGMGDDFIDVSEPELPKPEWEMVVQQEQLCRVPLPCFTVPGPHPRPRPPSGAALAGQRKMCRTEETGDLRTPSGSAECAPLRRRS